MNDCYLKEILSASGFPKLLPLSPNTRLGTVIHNVLELAAKGFIKNNSDFENLWDENISEQEAQMYGNNFEKHLIPISLHTQKFEVKKQLCLIGVQKILSRIKPRVISSFSKTENKIKEFSPEEWVETPDKKVGGKIDAVYKLPDGVEIIDYKTGTVIENTLAGLEVKKEYKIQLKIYAGLYYLKTGVWAKKLKVLTINQGEYEISFTPEESLQLIDKAKEKLDEVNNLILNNFIWEDLASPAPDTCRFCNARPVCKKYIQTEKQGKEWSIDISGRIKEKRELKNGYRVILEYQNKELIIRGLTAERHPDISDNTVNYLMIFNLRNDTSENYFIEGDFTTSYLMPHLFF